MSAFNPLIFEKMSANYDSLLKSGQLSDVVLVAGGKEIRAHKVILARSPVFAAMFAQNSSNEAQKNRVQITDVNVEVVDMLVRYIYTGKIEALDRYAEDLLMAADKYQLNCLKSICEQHFIYEISADTVSDFLIIADIYQATELNSKCIKYITNIYTCTRVKYSEGWKKILLRADLLTKLYEHLNSKYSKLINDEKKVESKKEDYSNSYVAKLVTANKCQLNCPKSICEQQLMSQITTESVSNLLILADMHQETELYTKCLDYIADNGTQVMTSEGWKHILAKADLLAKLYEHLSFKYSNAIEDDKEEKIEQEEFGYEVSRDFFRAAAKVDYKSLLFSI